MWQVYGLLLIVTVIAGLTPIAAGAATNELPPLSLPVFRFGLAGGLLWLTARALGLAKPVPRARRGLLIWLGVLCVPVNQLGFLYGIKLSSPTHGGIAYALVPVLVFWVSVALGRSTPTRRMALASALACVGALVVVLSTQQHSGELTARMLTGDLFLLSAAVSWSLFVVLSQPLVKELGAVRTLSLVMLIGTAFQLPIVLVDWRWFELATFSFSQVTWAGFGGLLFLTLITAYLNYLLWYVVTSRYDVTKSAIVTNAHFLITVLAESMLLGGVLSGWGGVGVGVGSGVLFAGVALASTGREKEPLEKVRLSSQDQTACPSRQ